MAKISIFGVMTNVQILLHTLFKGKCVGKDAVGNKYYLGKPRRGMTQDRRWVIYPGRAESSTVPAEWHGWLHHQTDRLPDNNSAYRQPWQKEHLANMTGTDKAYRPPGTTGHRPPATGDYTAWRPPQ